MILTHRVMEDTDCTSSSILSAENEAASRQQQTTLADHFRHERLTEDEIGTGNKLTRSRSWMRNTKESEQLRKMRNPGTSGMPFLRMSGL